MSRPTALALSCLFAAWALDRPRAAGTTAFAGRELDLWPSSAALGSAVAASRDPLAAVWANPAGLCDTKGQVGAGHIDWFLGTQAEQLAAALESGRLRLGLSAYLVSTEVPHRPPSGGVPLPLAEPAGAFAVREFTLGLSAAYQIDSQLWAGGTVRSLTQKVFTEDASTLAADLGLLWRPASVCALGASLANLGPALKWRAGAHVPLPRGFRAGTTLLPHPDWSVAADLWLLRGRSARVATGLEWRPAPPLALRAGYLAGSDSQHFSSGVGILWRGIGFDYALVPLANDLGTAHRAAVRVVPSLLRR